jgi:diaminopimelate decarboxylase
MTSPHRVAIVGLGPKGLFALERLLDHAQAGAPMQVDVYEPHPAPGAGPNYDPGQPEYLRMNYTAAQIDMWWPGGGVVPADERWSFVRWSECDPGSYPPRAHVGRYLGSGLALLLRRAPGNVVVSIRPRSVSEVTRSGSGSGWSVCGNEYDAVLIATGHAAGSVFPVDTWLSRERVRPGSRVAVRGFGLTFIDAALALTEGRGGRFEHSRQPLRLRYVPTEDDVVLVPYSRSGRPMLPKPRVRYERLEPIMQTGRERVREHPRDVVSILAETCAAALLAVDGTTATPDLAPAAEIERSLAIGAERARPDLQWAVGESWRGLYPAIVEHLGGDTLPADAWREFRRLAARMERVAFGPSPVNAAKLLALIEAGRVDLSDVRGGSPPGDVDGEIDAVLPGPEIRGELLNALVRAGHVGVAAGRRGISCDASGMCAPGLAVIGRPTEDWVIGNDTLSRTLHPQTDLWARRVVGATRVPQLVA